MVNESSNFQRIPGSAQHYRNLTTGQELTYRQFLNIRYQERGYTSFQDYLKQDAPELQLIRSTGFRDKREMERIHGYDMYEVYERIRMTKAGGVPIETLQDIHTPEGHEFQSRIAAMVRSGQWPGLRTKHSRALREKQPRINSETMRLYELLEIAPQDYQKMFDNLWWSP